MAQDHRQNARRIFMEVADLPESDRAAALERTCGGDTKLRAEVDALFRANGQAAGFMASPTGDKGDHGDASRLSMHFEATVASSPSASEQPGRLIGPYKLLEKIGEGGFGTVWMAEQREPVRRRVAIKLIKLGMDTKQVIARFEAERQALAMMDHPNIAKVLDAGSTDTGRPYFVMEYIRGIPILEYCDQELLDTKARLELFMSVCHAIQHAHQKGIIHRDIKPSNVLVTLHDGVPVPKVIDFGVAKATNSELTTKTLFTEHRQMIGTPAYMSPEQAEMSGLDIDTRSDIYSLGVLLYELLTGTTPFDVYDLVAKGYEEMMRIIREDEPHKPSTRISSLGDTSTRTASVRKVDVKTLGSLLRGDLDWIVMKCLEKDRARRYETANGLAADIKRHLSDEPVTAHAPSAGYKLRKFVRRNRAGVIAAGALAATLLIGVIAFAWQAKVARDQRDLAVEAKESESEQRRVADAAKTQAQTQEAKAKEQEAEAKKQEAEARKQEAEAKKQAAIAEAVARFQTEMLAAADPQKLLGDKVTVLQAMEAAVKELDEGSLADQPLVEARVRNTIGHSLLALARFDAAEPNLRKALEIWRAMLPAGHPDIATGLNNVATVLMDQNKLTEAEPLFREALEIMRAIPAERPDLLAGVVGQLAVLLQHQNKLTEAEPLCREALEIRRATLPADHPDIAHRLNNLGLLLRAQNRLADAEPLLREALEINRAALPAQHLDIATCLTSLAVLLEDRNEVAEAEPLFREALEIRRATLPAGHPDIGTCLNNLALHLRAQNKLVEAEPLLREHLEIQRAALPAAHPDIARALSNLSTLLQDQHKLVEAEPLLREALEIDRAAFRAGHPQIAYCLSNLAVLLGTQNKPAEAEPLLREALEIQRAAFPAGHPDTAITLINLASILEDQHKLAEAEPLLREALEIQHATLSAGHPLIASSLNVLAQLLDAQHRPAEAETLFREALQVRRAGLPAGHTDIAVSLFNLASLLRDQARLAEAEPLFREALRVARAGLPAGHPHLASFLVGLVVLLDAQNNLTEAEPLAREALEINRAALPAGNRRLLVAERWLADVYARQGKRDQAVPLIKELIESSRATLPKDSRDLAEQLAQLAQRLVKLEVWDEAEPPLREALTVLEKTEPDAWTTFNAKSLLGGALLGKKQLAEAEPLILAGYRGMKEREASLPQDRAIVISHALERLVQLYEAAGNATEAAAWRAKLEAARGTESAPSTRESKR